MTDLPTTAEELGELAQKGAIALVGAMATGAFHAARAGIARLFRRFGKDQEETALTQLDADEELVSETQDAERDDVRGELAPAWRRRLARLLNEDPAVAAELRDLLVELQTALPEERQQWVQTIIARDQGTAYAAMGGNVIHYDLGGKPASGAAGANPDGPR